ncbi:MAG: hypothetical protein NT086_07205 [Proteobacteria bacterium]|nr:hypothetical protein [Pseudomonadota bacterium]
MSLKNMPVKQQLSVLLGSVLLCILLLACYSYQSLTTVMINGQLYKQIIVSNNLIAESCHLPNILLNLF